MTCFSYRVVVIKSVLSKYGSLGRCCLLQDESVSSFDMPVYVFVLCGHLRKTLLEIEMSGTRQYSNLTRKWLIGKAPCVNLF